MLEHEQGLHVLKTSNGAAVNLVVGSKTFRLAEFEKADDAVSFALSINENNPDCPIRVLWD
jgi:hypothetical protein